MSKKLAASVLIPLLILIAFFTLAQPASVAAGGEAGTKFGLYVPPNGAHSGRQSGLVVTAFQNGTSVTITDVDEDGDDDDSVGPITLNQGQSYVLRIREGAVNDDHGGPDATLGDYFVVEANRPVVVSNLTYNTSWQHDFVPSDNRRMAGQNFYVYASAGQLLDVFAYYDNTDLTVTQVSAGSQPDTGLTNVTDDANGTVIVSCTLNKGEDLLVNRPAGCPLPNLSGKQTYHVTTNNDVTVMVGALSNQPNSRDGGGYVPSEEGYTAGRHFYFIIPNQNRLNERELRIVAYENGANVLVKRWSGSAWVNIYDNVLGSFDHVDLLGPDLGGTTSDDGYLFEVIADDTISVFETNWLETGNYNTSDISTYVSAAAGAGAGQHFQIYMGPPSAKQHALCPDRHCSHLYLFANDATVAYVQDTDSYGEYIELRNNSDATMDISSYYITNRAGMSFTLPIGASIPAGGYYLLEQHFQATNASHDYTYGSAVPDFALDNGRETITLHRPDGSIVDTVAYDDAVASHGVFYALERIDPTADGTQPGNWQDATVAVATANGTNLGAYFGTPGAENSGQAMGTGNIELAINEVMSGRIYERINIAEEGFAEFSLSRAEWEGLNNGFRPGNSNSLYPEKPYVQVTSDQPIAVMMSNWNDNWLTYVSSVLPPDPDVQLTTDYLRVTASQAVTFTGYLQNSSAALYMPVTRISLPDSFDCATVGYATPAGLMSATAISGTLATGECFVEWTHNEPMLSIDGTHTFQIWATLNDGVVQNSVLSAVMLTTGNEAEAANGDTLAAQDSAAVTMAEELLVRPDVVLNEVACKLAESQTWLELFNPGSGQVDITNWQLTDEKGGIFTIPADGLNQRLLDGGSYLVIVLGGDVADNNADTIYTGTPSAINLTSARGAISLYDGPVHDSSTLVDFVQWAADSSPLNASTDNIAVAAGLWVDNEFASCAASDGHSIGRNRHGDNGGGASDWAQTGGADAHSMTPGAVNWNEPLPQPTAIFGADFALPGVNNPAAWILVLGLIGGGLSIVRMTNKLHQASRKNG